MLIDVVIVAAGVGKRLGANIPKQYLKINDKTILEHSINAISQCSYLNKIILVLSKEDQYFQTLSIANDPKIILAYGGKERQDSVLNGLLQVKTEYAMVHDAARPFVTKTDLDNLCTLALKGSIGGILATAVSDTLKLAENMQIKQTVSRTNMYRALTPQLFRTKDLIEALTQASCNKVAITDEASAMEYLGYKVQIVEGSSSNFKITTIDDYKMAQAMFLRS